MPKQIALAYAIAGLAVAAALLVVLGSTVGLFQDKGATETVATAPAPAPAALPVAAPTAKPAADPALTQPAAQPIEYVYVDEPAPRKRHHHDDDDDHEESDDD